MIKDPDGKLKKYNEWHSHSPGIQEPSPLLFPTGVGGVLYPPYSLSEEVFNEKVFMGLSRHHDDAWLKAMSLLKGTQCKKVPSFSRKFLYMRGVGKRSLYKINSVKGGEGDEQIRAIFEYYNLYDVI